VGYTVKAQEGPLWIGGLWAREGLAGSKRRNSGLAAFRRLLPLILKNTQFSFFLFLVLFVLLSLKHQALATPPKRSSALHPQAAEAGVPAAQVLRSWMAC
jgi:hypothetical protein